MMKQTLKKQLSKILTVLLMFSFLYINIGSYRDNTQHKTNGFYANSGDGHVVATKVGYHKDGTIIDEGLEGVSFNLYKVTNDGNVQMGNTVTTDADGKIYLSGLEEGDYYLEELALPQGYEFEKDEAGNEINKYTFRISDRDIDAPLNLELKNIKEEGSFMISKEVVNADESPLTESQKQEEFEFVVLFDEKITNIDFKDDTDYTYSVNGGSAISIKNGDTIKLKSGETATFKYLKPLTKYKVIELVRDGYYVSSNNNEGTFISNSNVKFINTKVSEDTGSIVIHKNVEVYEGVEFPSDEYDRKFEFQVFFDSDKSYQAKISGQNIFEVSNGDLIYLKHGESISIYDLPFGMKYSVVESNYESVGYIAETEKLEANVGSNTLPMQYHFNNIYVGNGNNQEEELNFSVSKEVLNSNESNQAFEFFISFDTDKKIEYQIDNDQIMSHENENPIYIAHGQSINFLNVPKGTRFKVNETEIEGFETLINTVEGTVVQNGNEVIIKNFSTEESTKESTIIVTKTVEGTNTDKKFEFVLTLGNRVEKFSLSDGESIQFNVPVGTEYNLVEIDYSNEGFTQSISNGSGITNSFDVSSIDVINYYDYRNEKIMISGTKNWDVDENGKQYIPESITLDVYGDGIAVESVVVMPNEYGAWNYDLLLPKFNQSHKEITYTVKERSVDYFESEVDGMDITNILTLPTSYDIKVSKKVEGDILDKVMEFTFSVESIGNSPIHDKSYIKILGEGSAEFSTLKFDREGTFRYLIKEVDGKLEGITYDANPVMVTINVVRDGYQLKIDSVEYLKQNEGIHDSATFINTYKKVDNPQVPEDPNDPENPEIPESPEEKPSKPETPNGSGGGSQIGDLPHTGVAKSYTLIIGSFSILTGLLLILYKEDKKIRKYLKKEMNRYEEK